jgi:hypothetical protein
VGCWSRPHKLIQNISPVNIYSPRAPERSAATPVTEILAPAGLINLPNLLRFDSRGILSDRETGETLSTEATRKSDTSQCLFVGYALAIAAVIFAGFAKNYYLRAWLGTRAITVMVHAHGVVMTSWVALFVAQTVLAAKRRIDLHRRLGIAGGILAAVVVGLGVYTIHGSAVRQHLNTSIGSSALIFVAFDGLSLLLFGGLVLVALLLKSRPPFHKRLMLLAMISLLPPAFGRFVAYFTHDHVEIIVLLLMCATALSCVLIDTRRNRVLHPAFAWGGALIVLANVLTYFAQIAA